jgi:hypothetical protein
VEVRVQVGSVSIFFELHAVRVSECGCGSGSRQSHCATITLITVIITTTVVSSVSGATERRHGVCECVSV